VGRGDGGGEVERQGDGIARMGTRSLPSPILEKCGWFGNSKGFDQLTKEEVKKCMADIGMDADYQDYWTQNLWERIRQVGSFDRWIKFYWCELWDSFASIDGKVRRGETIDL
jgi:hypothetical protein